MKLVFSEVRSQKTNNRHYIQGKAEELNAYSGCFTDPLENSPHADQQPGVRPGRDGICAEM